MKLHLGSGDKRFDGFVNVDYDERCSPDIIQDLEKKPWCFEDNSIDEVVAHHLLEHLGDPGFFIFMQELYRVCKPNALVKIVVPHHRHDVFLNDPTHRRPITVEGLRLFSKKFNNYCIEVGDGSSKLGNYFDIDFEVVDFKFNFDSFYKPLLVDMTQEKEREIQLLIREKNNVIVDVNVTLLVVKND